MATRKQAGSGARGTGRSGGTGAAAKASAGRSGTGPSTSAGRTGSAARTVAANARSAQGKPGLARPGQGKPAQQRAQATPAQAGKTRLAAKPGQAGNEADGILVPRPAVRRRMTGYARTHKLEFASLLISVLGLGVSVYLTIEHFTSNVYAGCSATAGAVNCAKVTTSPQSVVFGIPVAVLGLAFFVFMVAINTPWGWRASQPPVHWARLGSVIVGIGFVLYLVYAELFLIGAICLYCTSVHVLTFLLFAVIVSRATLTGLRPSPARS